MRRASAIFVPALAALGLVLTSGAMPAAARGPVRRNCASIKLAAEYGRTEVSSVGVRCRQADRVARAWNRHRRAVKNSPCMWRDGSEKPGICMVGNWRCLAQHTEDGATYPVACRSTSSPRDRVVQWTMWV